MDHRLKFLTWKPWQVPPLKRRPTGADASSFAFSLPSCLSKCHDFLNEVCFFCPNPKCLYLYPGNADFNCLTNPGRKKSQLIVVDKTVASLIMAGTRLDGKVSVAIVTRKVRQRQLQKLKCHGRESDYISLSEMRPRGTLTDYSRGMLPSSRWSW